MAPLEKLPLGHAGCDEVGRGPLVGDVVAACVLFHDTAPEGIRDSKKLSQTKRLQLGPLIAQSAWVGFGHATAQEIDEIGIHKASLRAMTRAILDCPHPPVFVVVDGKFTPQVSIPCRAEIKGDDRFVEVAAAAIMAKLRRDAMMTELEASYPGYGFDQHQGYPTLQHREALERLGPTPEHRMSYKTLRDLPAVKNGKKNTLSHP